MAIEKCGVALPTGDHCAAAWLLLPNGASPGVQVPCIAMAVGLGAANAMCLELFARSVTEAAIVALLFDCRQFGASGGKQQPHGARNEQLDDYRSARTFRPRAAVGQHCERPNLGRAWLRDRRMDGGRRVGRGPRSSGLRLTQHGGHRLTTAGLGFGHRRFEPAGLVSARLNPMQADY
jgi:hypothetical protein